MTKARWAPYLLLSTILALGGCSTMEKTWNGWFGDGDSAAAAAESAAGEQVFYSGVEGLTVYGQASFSSKVLGRLALHEKVTRTRIEHGYAFIRTEEGGLEGWVDNAKLDWRKPAPGPSALEVAPPKESPAAKEPEPGGVKGAEVAAPTETPTPAAAASETPTSPPAEASPAAADAAATPEPTTKPKAEPKMFDPY